MGVEERAPTCVTCQHQAGPSIKQIRFNMYLYGSLMWVGVSCLRKQVTFKIRKALTFHNNTTSHLSQTAALIFSPQRKAQVEQKGVCVCACHQWMACVLAAKVFATSMLEHEWVWENWLCHGSLITAPITYKTALCVCVCVYLGAAHHHLYTYWRCADAAQH